MSYTCDYCEKERDGEPAKEDTYPTTEGTETVLLCGQCVANLDGEPGP